MPPSRLILGIESSCDETAAAVLRFSPESARPEILANVVASQVALHAAFGGVVPELASREHLRNIVPVVHQAISEAARIQAGVTLQHLDAIAVTEGPGLAGALLVGILYARSLAFALGKPLIAVNHLEGHIHAVLLESAHLLHAAPDPARDGASREAGAASEAPLLALVVSGGHTHLYLASPPATKQTAEPSTWTYRNVGRTVDDAAGEAFDKVAKLLGLGYPGGPWIDALAPHGNPEAVRFHFHAMKPRSDALVAGAGVTPDPRFDFSFSGIKTAVLRYTQTHTPALAASIEQRRLAFAAQPGLKFPAEPANAVSQLGTRLFDTATLDLIASFQAAVIRNLLRQTFAAAEAYGVRGILVSGGVAANRELRLRFTAEAAARGLPVAFPSVALSTDNAAMIAAAAWPRFLAGDYAPEAVSAAPQLKLG